MKVEQSKMDETTHGSDQGDDESKNEAMSRYRALKEAQWKQEADSKKLDLQSRKNLDYR